MKTCEQCGKKVKSLRKMPYLSMCDVCYKESMKSWNALSDNEKQEIRKENRMMGVRPID